MNTILRILGLGREKAAGFALVAVLVSLGTAASLFEPWIYRAIVDDVAGVFVTPAPIQQAERRLERMRTPMEHLAHSSQRIFRAPLKRMKVEEVGKRHLPPRTRSQAVATVIVGAVLLVVTRLFSELCRYKGDNRST